jgi:hypothetical protein
MLPRRKIGVNARKIISTCHEIIICITSICIDRHATELIFHFLIFRASDESNRGADP